VAVREQHQQQMEQLVLIQYFLLLLLLAAVAAVEMVEPVAMGVLVVVHLVLALTQPQGGLEIHLP
jgi:hypothetical protein